MISLPTGRHILAVVAACLLTPACSDDANTPVKAETALSVFGPYLGAEADRFAEVLAEFTDQTGIEVRYTGSADFASDLLARASDATRAPDVAMIPQLGLVNELVADERTAPLSEATLAAIDANYSPATRHLGTIDGTVVGVPFRSYIKSLVWYRPDVWEENGWKIPTSLSELTSLSLQIADFDDMAPWCMTMKSGTSTGWVATDWVEDLMIRRSGPETYRAWVNGDLAFTSEPVAEVFDEFQRVVLASGHLAGGPEAAIGSSVRSVFDGMFAERPNCAMAKQGDFAASWLPPDTNIGPAAAIDFFVLPAATAGGDPPLVAGGDLAVPFTASRQVGDLMEFLAAPDSGASWAQHGGFLSPKKDFPIDDYPDDTTRHLSELLTTAESVVLDGSDQMPVEIGIGLLWSEITKWVGGGSTYDNFAATLDDAFNDGP